MREHPSGFASVVPGAGGLAPPPGLVVEAATHGDVAGCVALARLTADGTSEAWSALFEHNVAHPDRHLVVARAGDDLIGFGRAGWFEPDATAPANAAPAGHYLLGLVVAPPWRRRGVATALIDARLDWIAARATEAWYFVARHNVVSIRLHERVGFVTVTDDFWFPTVTDGPGSHVLGRVALPPS